LKSIVDFYGWRIGHDARQTLDRGGTALEAARRDAPESREERATSSIASTARSSGLHAGAGVDRIENGFCLRGIATPCPSSTDGLAHQASAV
jgi:hypothetical protein